MMRFRCCGELDLRLGCWIAVFWAIGYGSAPVAAQLTVLSQGNEPAKWRESQLDALAAQLQTAEPETEFARELRAQQRWLSAWQPGSLATNPLWQGESAREPLQEPTIDPQRRAAELRERLLGEGARPTARDTSALEALLEKFPDDVGVRQLHLHWLDQIQYRKIYPDEIAAAALQLDGMLQSLPAGLQAELGPRLNEARAFCLYRRGRALAYRELPEVLKGNPLADPDRHAAEMVGNYRQLKSLVDEQRPEFILLDVRMLRRDHWNGRALEMLEDYARGLSPQWFLKKRRDVLRDLGWKYPAEEAAKIYASQFPNAVAAEQESL